MRISEVTISDLKEYANVYHNNDDNLFMTILVVAKNFISNYTGLPIDEDIANGVTTSIDSYEDLTIALMVISNELYDNRALVVDNTKLNFVIMTILDSHSVNFL